MTAPSQTAPATVKRERVRRLQLTYPHATEHEGSIEDWKLSREGSGPTVSLAGKEPGKPRAYVYIDNCESFHGEHCVNVGIGNRDGGLTLAPLAAVREVLRDYDSEAESTPCPPALQKGRADKGQPMGGIEWLAEMPSVHCPEGCVVYRDGVLGVVQLNDEGWTVRLLGHRLAGKVGMDLDADTLRGDPSERGWVHALNHEVGLSWVWLRIERHFYKSTEDECERIGQAINMVDPESWGPIKRRRWRDETTDADLIIIARAFAAVAR